MNANIAKMPVWAVPECARLCRDCAEICWASAAFMSRGSRFIPQILRSCIEICEACASECEKHSDNPTVKSVLKLVGILLRNSARLPLLQV